MYTCIIIMYVYIFPVASSVTDTQVTVSNPNVTSSAHSITVTCTIHPESNADVCVVMAVANNQVITSNEYVKSSYTLYMHEHITLKLTYNLWPPHCSDHVWLLPYIAIVYCTTSL